MTEFQREAFQGFNGRPPETDRELQEWLSTPEGKLPQRFNPPLVLDGAKAARKLICGAH